MDQLFAVLFMFVILPIFGLWVFVAIIRGIRKNLRMLKQMREQDLNWYRSEHPDHVRDGKVKCHQCAGTNIGTELVKNNTFMRRHMCRTCGTALYYSPEV